MTDSPSLPVQEESEEGSSSPPPPTPEEIMETRYMGMRRDGLVFDAYHAFFTRHLKHDNPNVRLMRRRNIDLLERSTVVVANSAFIAHHATKADHYLFDRLERPTWGDSLPLWLEWDGLTYDHPILRSGDTPIVAIWALAEVGLFPNAPEATSIRVNLLRLDYTFDAMVYVPNGSWAYEQTAPCSSLNTCPIGDRAQWALAQRPQDPNRFYVREFADERPALESGCACWRQGKWLSQFLSLLSASILAHGDAATVVEREEKVPQMRGMSRRAWEQKRDAIALRNRARPSYTRLHL
jgi:hypothetical protein